MEWMAEGVETNRRGGGGTPISSKSFVAASMMVSNGCFPPGFVKGVVGVPERVTC
jgi:hypothetical protein